jgi:hypothetical protein
VVFMVFDTMAPFLKRPGKGAILLSRTTNPGRFRLQSLRLAALSALAHQGKPHVAFATCCYDFGRLAT